MERTFWDKGYPFLTPGAGFLKYPGKEAIEIWKAGADGLVIGSFTEVRRGGYPPPNLYFLENGLLNAFGLPSPAPEDFFLRLEELLKNIPSYAIIASFAMVTGDLNKARKILQQISDYGVRLELNISCPNVKCPLARAEDIIKLALKYFNPEDISIKLPHFTDLDALQKMVGELVSFGINIVIGNSIPGTWIDGKGNFVLSQPIGGYSGAAILPITLANLLVAKRVIRERNANSLLIASGGVSSPEDMLRCVCCGAHAIQVCSELIRGSYYSNRLLREIAKTIFRDWKIRFFLHLYELKPRNKEIASNLEEFKERVREIDGKIYISM